MGSTPGLPDLLPRELEKWGLIKTRHLPLGDPAPYLFRTLCLRGGKRRDRDQFGDSVEEAVGLALTLRPQEWGAGE